MAQRRDLDDIRHTILTEAISPVTVSTVDRAISTDPLRLDSYLTA